MKIESVSLSAVVHSTESRSKVIKAIKNILGFEFSYEFNTVKGHYGNELTYIRVDIPKKHIKTFWKEIVEMMKGQRKFFLGDLADRLDDDNILHLRIDKQEAFLGNKALVSTGDALVLKIKVVTYPANRDKIIKELKDQINE